MSKKTLTKKQMIELLSPYPDDAKIEITILQSDIDKTDPVKFELGEEGSGVFDKLFTFGLPGDHGSDEDGIALAVWSEDE